MKRETLERNIRKHIDDRIRPVIERRSSAITDTGKKQVLKISTKKNNRRKELDRGNLSRGGANDEQLRRKRGAW